MKSGWEEGPQLKAAWRRWSNSKTCFSSSGSFLIPLSLVIGSSWDSFWSSNASMCQDQMLLPILLQFIELIVKLYLRAVPSCFVMIGQQHCRCQDKKNGKKWQLRTFKGFSIVDISYIARPNIKLNVGLKVGMTLECVFEVNISANSSIFSSNWQLWHWLRLFLSPNNTLSLSSYLGVVGCAYLHWNTKRWQRIIAVQNFPPKGWYTIHIYISFLLVHWNQLFNLEF